MSTEIQTNLFGENTPVKVRENKSNPAVSTIVDHLKASLHLRVLDGTIKDNRFFAYHLLRKFGLETTLKIIDATAQDTWWSGRITSTRKLYYSAVSIMSNATGRSYGTNKVSIDQTDF